MRYDENCIHYTLYRYTYITIKHIRVHGATRVQFSLTIMHVTSCA